MLVAMVVAAQAQSLTGRNWFADLSDDDSDAGLVMIFGSEGGCAMTMLMVDASDELTVTCTYMVPGTYTIDSNVIAVTLIASLAEVNAEIDTEGMTPEQLQVVKLLKL